LRGKGLYTRGKYLRRGFYFSVEDVKRRRWQAGGGCDAAAESAGCDAAAEN
jgi:hypothetical protein